MSSGKQISKYKTMWTTVSVFTIFSVFYTIVFLFSCCCFFANYKQKQSYSPQKNVYKKTIEPTITFRHGYSMHVVYFHIENIYSLCEAILLLLLLISAHVTIVYKWARAHSHTKTLFLTTLRYFGWYFSASLRWPPC